MTHSYFFRGKIHCRTDNVDKLLAITKAINSLVLFGPLNHVVICNGSRRLATFEQLGKASYGRGKIELTRNDVLFMATSSQLVVLVVVQGNGTCNKRGFVFIGKLVTDFQKGILLVRHTLSRGRCLFIQVAHLLLWFVDTIAQRIQCRCSIRSDGREFINDRDSVTRTNVTRTLFVVVEILTLKKALFVANPVGILGLWMG